MVSKPIEDFDAPYNVTLTGLEVYWLIYIAKNELARLQQTSAKDLRRKPIQAAFDKLSRIGQG